MTDVGMCATAIRNHWSVLCENYSNAKFLRNLKPVLLNEVPA
jgi:hypothetical protein